MKVPDAHQRRRNEIRAQQKNAGLFSVSVNEADEDERGGTSSFDLLWVDWSDQEDQNGSGKTDAFYQEET